MEKRSLPLHFYCRSARLLLKKATFARKSNLFADELRHLKKFRGLASSVIPSHPEYEQENGRKLAEDLELCMGDVRERIEELEEQLSFASSAATGRERMVGAAAVHAGVDEDEKPEKQYIWWRFARKLKEAAPCFSGKVHPALHQAKLVPVTGTLESSTFHNSGIGWYVEHSDTESVIRNGSLGQQENSEEDHGCLTGWSQCSKRLALSSPHSPGLVCNASHVTEPSSPSTGDKVQTLQAVMMELRDSVEGLKSRAEEEGKRWRARAEVLERKLKVLKDETKHELSGLRHQFRCESKKAVAEASKEFSREHKKNSGEQLDEPACGDFRDQVNQLVAQVQSLLMHELEKKLSDSICDLRGELRDELQVLEVGMSKDVGNLRQEMVSRFESLVELARIGKQLELNKLEQERTPPSDVNKQLRALGTDLSKEVNTLGLEHKSDDEQLQNRLQKQPQGCKDEVMQGGVDMEVMVKNFELDIKEDMIELKCKHQELEADIQQLKEQSTFGRGRHRSSDDDLVLMEQLQQFPKLYTGCLTDLQERVSRLEAGQEFVTSIQNSLERDRREHENSLALVAKERVLAAIASEAIAAALKAREVLEERLGSLQNSDSKPLKSQQQRPPKFSVRRMCRDAVLRLAAIRQKAGAKRFSVKATRKEVIGGGFYAGILSIESKIKAAVGILSMLNARIQRLEDVQVDQCQCLEEVRIGSHRLEEGLVRYEGTAKLVMEVEARVTLLESKEHTGTLESGEHTGRTAEEPIDMLGEAAVLLSQDSLSSFRERLLFLERRVEHIASVTYANFRLLGAKVEHVSMGVRSALDIASETEDKCSSLGAELVRVFRLILSFRESSKKQHLVEVKKREAVVCPQKRSLMSEAPAGEAAAKTGSHSNEHCSVKRINLRFDEKGTIISKVPV